MCEILFRGKLKADNGEHKKGDWVYGDIVRIRDGDSIKTCIYGFGEVDPSTIGQYSGKDDANGEKLFEGDIVKGLFLHGSSILSVVTFKDGAFGLEWNRGTVKTFSAFTSICNVISEKIGNIHDNKRW